MSEWWTYTPTDFLLYAPRTWYRLIVAYNAALWPLQLLAALAGAAIVALGWRGSARAGRVGAIVLSAAFAFVAVAWTLGEYATINWAAPWFAAASLAEAALLAWLGAIRGRLVVEQPRTRSQQLASALTLAVVVGYPLVAIAAGRTWSEAETFGTMPDPTAVAALAWLASSRGPFVVVAVVPLAWCAISGLLMWAMEAPDAWVAPLLALAAVVLRMTRRY